MKKLLLIPKLRIHNANALSSPYSIGFPAMTAWLGAVHALERRLRTKAEYEDLRLKSMAVICHRINLQTYKGNGDYICSIIGTGNPLDKNGDRPSFIEEARCHLNVSLIIECEELGLIDQDEFYDSVAQCLITMKMASGDILDFKPPEFIDVYDESSHKKLIQRLMPGHCLIERRDLMQEAMENGQDAIDAMLEFLQVTHRSELDENGRVSWNGRRKQKGWIVPIATGFHGISELGNAENQRNPDTPHRFAESVVTLGEFVMPYRIADLNNMLWHTHADFENNLYLCQQNQPVTEF